MIGGQIAAQDNPQSQVVDCNELIEGEIEYDLEPFNYTFACIGPDCYHDEGFLCHFQLASEMIKECEFNDLFCTNRALLASSSIDIQTSLEYPIFVRPQSLVDAFPEVLDAFSEGDYQRALTLLQDVSITEYFQHPVIYLSRGLLYEMLNQPEDALKEYDVVIENIPEYAFPHYLRGRLLGQLGRELEASFETAWLEDYLIAFAPDLLSMIEPLQELHLFDKSKLETWMKYLVMTKNSSPGGELYFDLTQTDATPVKIAVYDDPPVMFAQDVSFVRYPWSSGVRDVVNTYVLTKIDEGDYIYEFYIPWASNITLNLEFRDNLIFGKEYSPGAESYGKTEFILAPINTLDPREVFGEPICEGGVISRLRPGMFVTEIGYIEGFYYVVEPGAPRDGTLYFDDGYRGDQTDPDTYPWLEVRVTDNFTCIDDVLWWEVSDGQGNTGWKAENDGMGYRINPKYDLKEFFNCPDAPPLRLFNRGEAHILTGFGANNLRSDAGMNADLLTQIPEGEIVTVLNGPVCADGMAWWNVQYGETFGWTAEGSSDTYWLEPVFNW